MKILTSITMSFIFLFQGIALDMDLCEQIDRASDFIFHYQEHKSFNDDSFVEYAFEELFSENHDDDAHHNNSNQNHPTHTNNQCCHALVFVTPTNSVDIKSLDVIVTKQYGDYNFNFNSRYLESLFQPPRV